MAAYSDHVEDPRFPALDENVLVPTGVQGLDSILAGGYARYRVHLVEGAPGSGKTTLGLQFLLDGIARGERGLYITLSETRNELVAVAKTHGWSLDGIEIYELVPAELSLDPNMQQTVVYASDFELGETIKNVLDQIERLKPHRVVFDSLSEIRLLAQSSLRYRRQVLALKHHFAGQACTVLMLDDLTSEGDDLNLHSISHGVIRLEQLAVQYGAERRRVRVFKMRGTQFRGGFHDFIIRKGGVRVFPRLVASEHHRDWVDDGPARSGVPELDQLTGGGLDRGTSTLLIGPAGSGKSSLAFQFIYAALQRGERVVVFSFDETRKILLKRTAGMGIDIAPYVESGMLRLEQVDPAELSPGELVGMVRDAVEGDVQIVVLDSLSGFMNAMPEEHFMLLQLHELLTYLNQQGVITLMILAQHGMVGQMQSPVDLTYLSDTVLLLRFFEAQGTIRHAISVIKKRTGPHEKTIREYHIDRSGVRIGDPLDQFHGILTGVPTFKGDQASLIGSRDDGRS
jgi:circadian clock protein KaiC